MRTVTIPVAGETGDSVYWSRNVSLLVAASFDAHNNVKDSRETPLNDCVTMLDVDVGETDELVGGSVVVTAVVVGGEIKDPSGLVFGDDGFNVVVVGAMIGAERLVGGAAVVDATELDGAGDVVGD